MKHRLILSGIITVLLLSGLLTSAGAHEIQIGSGDDDATERDEGVFNTTQQTIRIYSNTDNTSLNYRCGGFRFEDIPIPQGSEMESAYLELFFTTLNDMNAVIYAQDNDDTLDFVTNQTIIDNVGRPKTTAKVPWIENNISINSWENSDNIASLIQEVVDRPGWVDGNSITILLIAQTDQDLESSVRAYEFGVNTFGARLHLFWEPTIEDTDYPTLALPRSTIFIQQELESHGDSATNVSATINFNDNRFEFLSNYPENDNTIENCADGEVVCAKWFVSPPAVEDNYTFNVEWSFLHDNIHVVTSDNFNIEVRYFVDPTPHTIPVFPLSSDALAISIVALGAALGALAFTVLRRRNGLNNEGLP